MHSSAKMTPGKAQFLPDEAATEALGADLAAALEPGDLMVLNGGLGAGKTALARALIRTLMKDPQMNVPSPSFALVQSYESPLGPILHADLYRLNGTAEIDELGLFERADAIVLVEWAERVPGLAARADMAIDLSIPPDGAGRNVTIWRRQ